MRSLIACMKKEWMEQLRAGRVMILAILFFLFGVMNPATAMLTPWLMEIMAESLAQSGMVVTEVAVTALDSWMQFFKNIPMGLIVFVLLESSIFTREYESGTLVLALTKGLRRPTMVAAKSIVLSAFWTAGYWLCFAVTYFYTVWYWDNSVVKHLAFSCVCWWLFGMLVVSLCVLFSSFAKSNSTVLLGTGGVVVLSYVVSLLPKIQKFLPTLLMDGNSLIYGLKAPEDYAAALAVTVMLCAVCFAASIPVINRRQI